MTLIYFRFPLSFVNPDNNVGVVIIFSNHLNLEQNFIKSFVRPLNTAKFRGALFMAVRAEFVAQLSHPITPWIRINCFGGEHQYVASDLISVRCNAIWVLPEVPYLMQMEQ